MKRARGRATKEELASAERLIQRRITHLKERVEATANPETRAQKAAHTRAANLLRIEERRMQRIKEGKDPWD